MFENYSSADDGDLKWSEEVRNEILKDVESHLYNYLYKNSALVYEIESAILDLTNLTMDELLLLKKVHFLESDEVKNLICASKVLLKNLSHSTVNPVNINNGLIKGNVDWNKTFKERSKEGFSNQSAFACRTIDKIYDLPENQLLKFLLNKIVDFTKNNTIGDSKPLKLEESEVAKWQDTIINRKRIALKIVNNVRMREITSVTHISTKMLRNAYNSKNNLYKHVVKCYNLYQDLFLKEGEADIETLKDLISRHVLRPLSDNRLFEIYVLFKLLDVFPHNNLTLWLLRPENKSYVSECLYKEKYIRLYFQRNPISDMSAKARLSSFYPNVGLKAGLPDIIIEIEKVDSEKEYRFLEVKNTENDTYIKRGLIETLAYLKEFEHDISFTSAIKGVVVSFGGIKEIKHGAFNEDILLLDKVLLEDEEYRKIILNMN